MKWRYMKMQKQKTEFLTGKEKVEKKYKKVVDNNISYDKIIFVLSTYKYL